MLEKKLDLAKKYLAGELDFEKGYKSAVVRKNKNLKDCQGMLGIQNQHHQKAIELFLLH